RYGARRQPEKTASPAGLSLAEWLPSVRYIFARDNPTDDASCCHIDVGSSLETGRAVPTSTALCHNNGLHVTRGVADKDGKHGLFHQQRTRTGGATGRSSRLLAADAGHLRGLLFPLDPAAAKASEGSH